jgi:glycosyltransferase involved in cell wall biosynthesis
VPDLVQNGTTGFLAGPGEEQGLAETISKLLKDDALRLEMSRRARAFVEERHALNSLPHQLEALYRRMLPKACSAEPSVYAKAI